MKKILVSWILPCSLFSQSTLIFSEYGEGSSNNKWVEIYNPTFTNAPLDEYRYNFCWNGCDSAQWEFSIPFDSGYILLTVVGLYYSSFDAIVDIIGVFDTSNVNIGWDVDGVVNATHNQTMIRKTDVCGGNIGDWSLSDGTTAPSQWIVGVIDDFSNLNIHSFECVSSTSVSVLNSIKRKLVEIRDILGRKTKFAINQPLFYVYNDGSVKKRFVTE